ncbi:hypothetical protein BV22DRAFT_1132163 [Leucogyrophana mollusca]|uniref:Uncharacterized protein n=1 Tax=Leucogyrophana mollusca TaxID=85980 RepID=A0ACB8B9X1_9AGAM|nr:hypothetical protein BV22DRAFT_1132163 [Leucogyrophana mollusca]
MFFKPATAVLLAMALPHIAVARVGRIPVQYQVPDEFSYKINAYVGKSQTEHSQEFSHTFQDWADPFKKGENRCHCHEAFDRTLNDHLVSWTVHFVGGKKSDWEFEFFKDAKCKGERLGPVGKGSHSNQLKVDDAPSALHQSSSLKVCYTGRFTTHTETRFV